MGAAIAFVARPPEELVVDLNPHLSFDGECEAAFRYYAGHLGGKIEMLMTYGASPLAAQTPTEWHGRILHATLELGDQRITGGDSFPGQYRKPAGVSVMLNIDEPAEADRIFQALAEGGAVEMPIQATFWARRFGMVTDRFGIPFVINCGAAA
jgi:PhnB protein